MSILLTGGTGYIGSHTAVELINAGYDIVIADNLSNSEAVVIDYIETITKKRPKFYQADVCDKAQLEKIFDENKITAVLHFAGYKAVGESVSEPIKYYRNNLDSAITLLEVMQSAGCNQFIFSSSATVYGTGATVPYKEEMPTGHCANPYGWTKYMIEQILTDAAKANNNLSVVLLRYFNPVGAHESGLIGEKPVGVPNNLMPYITQTAAGMRDHLSVFGNDYDTKDGTGVRDFIHVVDLAKGHVKALEYANKNLGCEVFNLGTGTGYSVLDLVNTFMEVNGINIPYEIAPRRAGDIATSYANATKAKEKLGWQAQLGLKEMCKDAWNFQKNCK
ncbi:MAG: UDP-glucose 4-epimerase GalE [Bacillota bacterium]|nr:UDP-glucose 4-epimerase GalE [Bacillota bacterium]